MPSEIVTEVKVSFSHHQKNIYSPAEMLPSEGIFLRIKSKPRKKWELHQEKKLDTKNIFLPICLNFLRLSSCNPHCFIMKDSKSKPLKSARIYTLFFKPTVFLLTSSVEHRQILDFQLHHLPGHYYSGKEFRIYKDELQISSLYFPFLVEHIPQRFSSDAMGISNLVLPHLFTCLLLPEQ